VCNRHGKVRPTDFTENYNTVAVFTDVDFFRLPFLPVAVITCCRFYRCLFYLLPFFSVALFTVAVITVAVFTVALFSVNHHNCSLVVLLCSFL